MADGQQSQSINLPPGFQLENSEVQQPQPQQSAQPQLPQSSLPPGFVLEQPQEGTKPDGGVLGNAALGALAGSVSAPDEPTLAQLQAYAKQIGVPIEDAPKLSHLYKDAVQKQQVAANQTPEYKKQG